jgi:hypothetical protein
MSLRVHLLTAFLVCASAGFAQQATLTGTITDQSGAVVANAPVTVTHIETGTVISGATSATGNYTVSQLAIGTHNVTVALSGFKTYKRENVQLAAAQVLRLDISLEIGAQTESVTVTAAASMMKTDSSAVVHNITLDQMRNLPLMPVNGAAGSASSNGFRDPFAVAQMLPGVRYQPSSVMEVNGLPTGSVQFRLEGQVMGNARGGFEALTHSTQPSVDAIEEVAVVTSNYAAEFGSVAGALFNVVMKSGGNQYHGSVYDYAVNEVLNATDPGAKLKNVERRHDYGGTFGGPVWIPKIYDGKNRTFFFFSMEQFRLKQVINTSPSVPTPDYRNGDFSALPGLMNNVLLTVGTGAAATPYIGPTGQTITAGTLFDPGTRRQVTCNTAISPHCGTNGSLVFYRDPLPGNKLRVGEMDSVALAIQNKYIPLPVGANATSGVRINNYQTRPITNRVSNLPSIKVDQNLTSAARLSVFWQTTRSKAPAGGQGGNDGYPVPITTNRGTNSNAPQTRVTYNQTITPTLQLQVGAGYSMYTLNDATQVINYNPAEDIGLKGVELNRNFPIFGNTLVTNPALGGYGSPGAFGLVNGLGPTVQGLTMERRPSALTSLTWIRGNHTIKGGGEWRMDMLPSTSYSTTAGNFGGFAAANSITWQPSLQATSGLSGQTITGFPYANFLLGSVRSFTMATPTTLRTSKRQWGFYLQDNWRATSKLTLDLGIRWDMGTYSREDGGRNGALSLNIPNPSASGRLGALMFERTCNCSFAQNYPYALGPRVGFAYTINPRTVIRGGIGVSYSSTGTFGGFTQNTATAPTPAVGEDIFKLRDGVPASVDPVWPVFDPNLGHPVGSVVGAQTLLDPNAGRPSRILQWNVSLQREITRNLVVEASYVANRGVWQSNGSMSTFNNVSEQLLAHYGFKLMDATDNTLLNTNFNNLTTAQKSTLANRGVIVPYPNFPTSGTTAQTVFQSLRPYPQYNTGIAASNAPLGLSWYDALQVSVNKRYSHGLMVVANYTLSKNLNANSLDDVFNPNYSNKDLDSSNLPQQIRVSFEYQVPRPPSYIPVLGNKWVSQAIGGWGVAMSLRYQGGFYLSRPAHGAATPISRWLGRGPGSLAFTGGAQLKKNADGSFMNPWSVDWTDYDGNRHTEPIDINCKCFDPEKTIVLNPNVWTAVEDGKWPISNQILSDVRGPRQPQESGNLSRNFKFGKDGRMALQVRVEFQNIFNRKLLPITPQISNLNWNQAPTRSTDGRYTAGFGTFGNLRVNNAFGAERSGVFVGRFTF